MHKNYRHALQDSSLICEGLYAKKDLEVVKQNLGHLDFKLSGQKFRGGQSFFEELLSAAEL